MIIFSIMYKDSKDSVGIMKSNYIEVTDLLSSCIFSFQRSVNNQFLVLEHTCHGFGSHDLLKGHYVFFISIRIMI